MNEKDVLDKTLIYIDSTNSTFVGTNDFDINFDLSEPIKNVVRIMKVQTQIILNPSQTINGNNVQDGDPIFIQMKDYYRVVSNVAGNNVKCFDYITLDLSDKFGTNIPNTNVMFKSDKISTNSCDGDINTYVINPVEPNMKRLDIRLFDKNYNIIPRQNIQRFSMTLCVFHNRKKITQF